jgi:serine/threonine protein kinase
VGRIKFPKWAKCSCQKQTRSLRIGIGLATALGQVHRRGLIHKDIKPANVVVDTADNVWLTGFGIASQLLHECQAPPPPEIIAGTLAYMAPEQTGRMNRSIGTRSDLYSLGVTLYQMLTGALPFAAADPLEWVHCHIAPADTTWGSRRSSRAELWRFLRGHRLPRRKTPILSYSPKGRLAYPSGAGTQTESG